MSQHTGYAAILDGETVYGITLTDVEEYAQPGGYTALVLAGTFDFLPALTDGDSCFTDDCLLTKSKTS